VERQQHANWISQANSHWKEHQPKRYAALMKAGTLGQTLAHAADETGKQMQTLREQGFSADQAWEMVRDLHLFPPEEPGASSEAPDSPGYLAQREVNSGLGSLLMPGEREH
jgi:hypothetical protein